MVPCLGLVGRISPDMRDVERREVDVKAWGGWGGVDRARRLVPSAIIRQDETLPHAMHTVRAAGTLTPSMHLRNAKTRGARLIGAVAAYGLCLGRYVRDASDSALEQAYGGRPSTRPTGRHSEWGLE